MNKILPGVNVSGNVTIRELSSIGTGSRIIQNIAVGEETFVGAGAVVIRDIPKKVTAVGNPSKIIKYINGEWD